MRWLAGAGALAGLGVVFAGFVWARSEALVRAEVPAVAPVPVPWPTSDAEREELARQAQEAADKHAQKKVGVPEGVPRGLDAIDLGFVASMRASQRGSKLARGDGGCTGCHGRDLGGAVWYDGPRGRVVASNLTALADGPVEPWVLALRHDVRPDGRRLAVSHAAQVPWTDQQVSDLVSYARVLPAVDRELPAGALTAQGRLALALGLDW